MRKKLVSILLVLTMFLSLTPQFARAAGTNEVEAEGTPVAWEVVSDEELASLGLGDEEQDASSNDAEAAMVALDEEPDQDEMVRVSIVLDGKSTLAAGYPTMGIAADAGAMSYRSRLYDKQTAVQTAIETEALDNRPLDVVWNLTLAANIISANVRRSDIEAIAGVNGVAKVVEETRYDPQVIKVGGEYKPQMAISGTMNGTVTAWSTGYTGAGTKIAIIDTGIDNEHQSFDEGAFNYAIEQWKKDNPGKTVDLMDRSDVESHLAELNVYKRAKGSLTVDDLYYSSKIPFAYNYIDRNTTINHLHDSQGEHGSHVAGISAANRYIPDGDGYVDALDTVKVAGNAPDAQLIVMKVFGYGGGSYDSDYMAAVEDAIILGADSINMSLGGAHEGFSKSETYQDIMDLLAESDTMLSVAAGNAGNWGETNNIKHIYTDGVSWSTLGQPGSFESALTVASVENDGLISNMKVAEYTINYYEGKNATRPLMPSLDPDGEGTAFGYLMLPESVSKSVNWNGDALTPLKDEIAGKVAVVWRDGITNFALMANKAAEAGAAAVIIANNAASGAFYADLSDPPYTGNVPVVTVTRDAAVRAFQERGTPGTKNGFNYYTGTVTIYGAPHVEYKDSENKTLSYYSSWGVNGDLRLKPEIAAPGGNIWSVWGENGGNFQTHDPDDHNDYELMSGTSMAAPQIAGMAAQVQQYLKDKGLQNLDGLTGRELTQLLLMGTAHPMKTDEGLYYPVLQQGAGLANVADAVNTPVYITVEGQEDGKAKAEIGDDPSRKGVYEITFTLHNFSKEDASYDLSLDLFTQDIQTDPKGDYYLPTTRDMEADVSFIVDGMTVKRENLEKYDFDHDFALTSRDAQLLLDHVIKGTAIEGFDEAQLDVSGDGKVDTYDVHVFLNLNPATAYVPAGSSTTVTAVVTLTDAEKATLKAENPTGAFIEGFLRATSRSDAEGLMYPALNFPILGYYGSWTEPSMFEVSSFYGYYRAYNNGLSDRDTYTLSDFSSTRWYSNFVYYGEAHNSLALMTLGDGVPVSGVQYSSGYLPDDDLNAYCAFSSEDPHLLPYTYVYTPIRNAGGIVAQVTDHEDGTLYYRSEDLGPEFGTYQVSTGYYMNEKLFAQFNWNGKDLKGQVIPDGTLVDVSVVLAPEYYAEADGTYDWDALTDGNPDNKELADGAFLTSTMVVDNEKPEFTNGSPTAVESNGSYTLNVSLEDNFSLYCLKLYSQDGEVVLNLRYDDFGYPTDDLDIGEMKVTPTYTWTENGLWSDVYYLQVWDQAFNKVTYRLFVGVQPTDTVQEVRIASAYYPDTPIRSRYLVTGERYPLYGKAYPVTLNNREVTWKSDNPDVVEVSQDGLLTAKSSGQTIITATSVQDPSKFARIAVDVRGFKMDVNAILWDEDANPNLVKFNTDGMSKYQVIHPYTVEDPALMTLAYVDNVLYGLAASEENGTDIYRIDQTTYETEYVAHTNTFVADAANSYYIKGLIVGVSEDKIVLLDPNAGNQDALKYSFTYTAAQQLGTNLVAVAYEYSLSGDKIVNEMFKGYDVDAFWFIDDAGNIYQDMLLMNQVSGVPVSSPLAAAAPTQETGFSTDSLIGSSAYYNYEKDLLIWSRYTEQTETTDVIVWDRQGSNYNNYFYNIGSFGENICPVSGLINLEDLEMHSLASVDRPDIDEMIASLVAPTEPETSEPAPQPEVESAPAPDSLPSVEEPVTEEDQAEENHTPVSAGGLFSIDVNKDASFSAKGITVDTEAQMVTVPVYAIDSTNGEFTLTYDSKLLKLEGVIPGSVMTSVDRASGSIHVGYASKDQGTAVAATAVFSYRNADRTTLTLDVKQDGQDTTGTVTDYQITLLTEPTVDDNPPAGNSDGKPKEDADKADDEDKTDDETTVTPESPALEQFTDLAPTEWYYDDVSTIVSAGLMNGVDAVNFAPNTKLQRGMLVTILHRMSGLQEADTTDVFADVPDNAYYAEAVQWASANDLVDGRSDVIFAPLANITRQELCVILWRYAMFLQADVRTDGTTIPDFADRDQIASWAGEAISWAYRNGIMTGKSGNILDPTGTATRAEACTMLARFMRLMETSGISTTK